jgi:hypothetical protein
MMNSFDSLIINYLQTIDKKHSLTKQLKYDEAVELRNKEHQYLEAIYSIITDGKPKPSFDYSWAYYILNTYTLKEYNLNIDNTKSNKELIREIKLRNLLVD